MNGTRPSPLKIAKDSHFIQKQQQKRQPVIIYTHSPKIIHTQARDFMALVQKLTGMSQSEDEITHVPSKSQNREMKQQGSIKFENDDENKSSSHDDNESSSVVTDEKCGKGVVDNNVKDSSCSFDGTRMLNLSHPYFADIPLFTPTPVYRFQASSDLGGLPRSSSFWSL